MSRKTSLKAFCVLLIWNVLAPWATLAAYVRSSSYAANACGSMYGDAHAYEVGIAPDSTCLHNSSLPGHFSAGYSYSMCGSALVSYFNCNSDCSLCENYTASAAIGNCEVIVPGLLFEATECIDTPEVAAPSVDYFLYSFYRTHDCSGTFASKVYYALNQCTSLELLSSMYVRMGNDVLYQVCDLSCGNCFTIANFSASADCQAASNAGLYYRSSFLAAITPATTKTFPNQLRTVHVMPTTLHTLSSAFNSSLNSATRVSVCGTLLLIMFGLAAFL